MKTKTNKNPLITFLLVAATSIFIFVGQAQPAHAQWTTISTTIGDIPRKLGDIWTNIKKRTGSRAFQQAIRSVSYKLAQDTALWISSGGKGKKPLIFENFGKWASESADVVAGKYLVNLSQGWPVNLCSPSNIRSKLSITVGLKSAIDGLEFRKGKINQDTGAGGCKLTAMGANFAKEAKKSNFLVKFSQDFTGAKSDLGIAAQLQEDIKKKKEEETQAQMMERIKSGDKKAVEDIFTKFPNTPAEDVWAAQEIALKRAAEPPPRTEDIFLDTLAVFSNTLAKSYMAKLRSGFYPFRKTRTPDSPLSDVAGADVSDKALLASFAEFSPERALQLGQSGEIDLFADMLSCPPGQYQTPYNCLLSDGLSQAVQQKLTVKQALERKALSPDMIFPETHNPDQPKLSLLNLRKLRFLRVLPLGWEIAAEKLENASRRDITLSTVVNCFDPANPDPKCKLSAGGGNDLAGLIDPDWVLTLPQQFCRAQGWIGVTAHEQSPNRSQACVDLQSCVKQDENGKCEGFGYCTRERQLWQISGQSCDAQYATCQNFTRPNGTALSVLGSSVNNAGCREDSAGCSWYSQTPSPGGTGATSWDAASRVYLNSQAQSCRSEDAGSREIIPLEPGANLIRNSGFDEEFAGASISDNNWEITAGASIVNEGQPGSASGDILQRINIKSFTYYTLSFFARQKAAGGAGQADVVVSAANPTDALLRNVSFAALSENQKTVSLTIADINLFDGLTRWAASFYTRNTTRVNIKFSGDVVFDNVQLEEIGVQQGKRAEEQVAANPDGGAVVLNSSPPGSVNVASPATSYKGYEDNRRLVFAKAESCAADEATARAYTSTLSQETIIARLSPDGLCPKECGGLTSFLAMPTPMDIASDYKTPQVRSFVPTYGKACSASEVGCEEFTNITQKGAEKRQYFSQIRACVAETNPNNATFYTWEGKEQAGFQLKVWRLLKDNNGSGPCATFTQGAGQDPTTAACQDLSGGSVECNLYDDNCRVFLDEGGTEYRRDITKIVSVSSECTAFRRTKLPPAAAEQTEQEVWHFIPSEARTCGATAVACREYKGSRANVVYNVMFSNFEESGLDNWTGGALSTETAVAKSVIAGSQSFSFNGIASKDIGPALSGQRGNMLLLRFLAKANGASATINGALYQSDGTTLIASFANAAVSLTSDWQSFTLGPIELKEEVSSAILKIESAGAVFIDNITLSASPDRLYLITDSWKDKQPAQCAALPDGSSCNAYTDKKSNTFYVSGFDALFSEQAQYCEAVIDTQNSESPFSQSFNAANDAGSDPNRTLDNITVLADQFMYRYIKAGNLRNKDAAGCTALGAPQLDSSDAVTAWDATYRKLEPDNFGSALCLAEAVGCQAFRAEDGGTKVFRDPGKKLCVWDVEDSVFVQLDDNGQSTDCPTDYAKTCPSDQGGCTAYAPVNPNLTEGANTTLFTKRDTVDSGNCSGEDIGLGCVNFTEGWSGGADPNAVLPDKLSSSRERMLKVDARRECAEWLAPTTTSEVNDPTSRSVRIVVYDLGRCQKLDAGGGCEQWTRPGETSYPAAYGDGAAKLQTAGYVGRLPLDANSKPTKNLFSGAWDYSGYSLPDQYPLELLSEDALAKTLKQGSNKSGAEFLCRSYPEEDSPFDSSALEYDPTTGAFKYGSDTRHLQNVNKFEKGEYGQCSYKKAVSTEGENKYFQIDTVKPFPENTKSITDLSGWSGYCLDWDEDTRDPATNKPLCLSWWPVDVVQAGANIFDNHPEAGYTSSGPLYYCLAAKGNKITNENLQYVESKDNTYLITVAKTKTDAKKGMAIDNSRGSRNLAFNDNFYLAATAFNGNTLFTPLAPLAPADAVPPSSGPNSPNTAVNDATQGVNTWSNFNNAKTSDNIRAKVERADGITNYLKVTNFNFSIPPNETINGILVEVEKQQSFSGVTDNAVRIVKNGTIGSTDKSSTTGWPLFDSYVSYGGPADLWGQAWSPAEINNPGFGFAISANITNGEAAYIDHIRITVYYGTEVQSGGGAGPDNGSGVMQYRARDRVLPGRRGLTLLPDAPISPLAKLHEYDIEAIILTARNAESSKQWPANNEQLILNREGFAASPLEDVATSERWTALWCGGRDTAQCKFGGEYTWGKFKTAIDDTAGTDACGQGETNEDSIDRAGGTNLLALRARFADEKGNGGDMGTGEDNEFEPYQFLGLEGGLCDNTGAKGWTDLQVSLQLREWCTAVAQVHTGTTNKAWTGRVSGKSEVGYPPIYYNDNGGSFGTALNYLYKQDNPPFGAAAPPVSFIHTPEEWDGRKDFTEEEVVENGQLVTVPKSLEPGKQPLYVEAIKGKGQIRAGSPYYCGGTTATSTPTCEAPPPVKGQEVFKPRTSGLDQALLHLKQIFAKVVKVWRWAFNEIAYDEVDEDYEKRQLPEEWDEDLAELIGDCPVIEAAEIGSGKAWVGSGDKNAVYSANCGTDVRYAGRYSVNGARVAHANGTVADPNGTVVADPFVAVGIGEEAALTFYGYNENGEQLPLKQIEIDWDDGVKTKTAGSFKNHRANCSPTGNYGQSSRACDINPFQFKHVYQKKGGYTPTVKITDNWGRWTLASYAGTVIRVDTGLVSRTPPAETKPLAISNAPAELSVAEGRLLENEGGTDINVNRATQTGITWRRRVQPISGESWITIDRATGQLSGNTSGRAGPYTIYVVASEVITNADGSKTQASAQARIPLIVTPQDDLTALGWWATYRNSGGRITNPGTVEAFPVIKARAESGPALVPGDDNRYPLNFAEGTKRLNSWLPTDVGRVDGENREYFTVVWQGLLVIKPSEPAGQYKFRLGSDDGADLFIDNQLVINNGGNHDYQMKDGYIFLVPGLHDIRVRYYNNDDESEVKLEWRPPGQPSSVVLPIGTAEDPRIKHIPPPMPTLTITSPTASQVFPPGTTQVTLQVSIANNPGGQWRWQLTNPFTGNTGNTVPAGNTSVISGLQDGQTYNVYATLTGSDGKILDRQESADISFSVAAPPPPVPTAPLEFNYTTSASGNITVTQGGSGSNTVSVTRQEDTINAGVVRQFNFHARDLPAGATASFSPASCTPQPPNEPCSSTLTVTTAATTPVGNHTIIIDGNTPDNIASGATLGQFTLTVLAPPTLLSPVNNYIGSSITPVLSWQSSGAPTDGFQLQVYSNMSLSADSLVFNGENIVLSLKTVTGLSYKTNYWWRVRENLTGGGQGPWSSVWHFTTRLPP